MGLGLELRRRVGRGADPLPFKACALFLHQSPPLLLNNICCCEHRSLEGTMLIVAAVANCADKRFCRQQEGDKDQHEGWPPSLPVHHIVYVIMAPAGAVHGAMRRGLSADVVRPAPTLGCELRRRPAEIMCTLYNTVVCMIFFALSSPRAGVRCVVGEDTLEGMPSCASALRSWSIWVELLSFVRFQRIRMAR